MYKGKADLNAVTHLQNGEECILVGYGQSMMPIIRSGQSVKVTPMTEEVTLEKDDIVFCKVNRHFYIHKISAIKNNNNSYQISNNHGHINGWISRKQIYGKVIEIL